MITHRDLMVGMVNTYLQGFPELEQAATARSSRIFRLRIWSSAR